MDIDVSPLCRYIATKTGAVGCPVYLVGGAVRDALLGYAKIDTDLCGPKSPAKLASLEIPGISVRDAVNGLGTATLICASSDLTETYEYTAFRTDSYSAGGAHIPESVIFTDSMEVDAHRRDFTINALYADPVTGKVFDPLHRGITDLKEKTIRMVRRDTMNEDALRILRMVRFAVSLGFSIDPDTFAAAKRSVPLLHDISQERIRKEFFLILLSDTAYGTEDGPLRGLFLLKDLGALTIIIPEMKECAGFSQSPRYHRYDVLDHLLYTCAATPPDLTTRLAALLHDISKPEAYNRDGNMYRHAQDSSVRASQILGRLKSPVALRRDVCSLISDHMFDLTNTARPATVRKHILKLGPGRFRRLAALRIADFKGSGMEHEAASAVKWMNILSAMEEHHVPFSVRDLAVTGDDLMRELHLKPGPQIGEILRALLPYAAAGPDRNSYKSLVKYARLLKTGIPK